MSLLLILTTMQQTSGHCLIIEVPRVFGRLTWQRLIMDTKCPTACQQINKVVRKICESQYISNIMKDTWKSLKSIICPRQNWTKDSDQVSCHCCNRQFIRLFRRRHHCRSCGKLFCSQCADNYINGTFIDPGLEKYLRLCERCNQKVQASIRQLSIRFGEELPDKSQDQSSSSDEQEFEILPIFQESKSRSEKQLLESVISRLHHVASHLCKLHQIEETWVQVLAGFALQAVQQVVINTISLNEPMDITRTVKIQTVETSQQSATRLFKGHVSVNNILSKQMATNFTKPRIVIIQGSIQLSSFTEEKLKFQDIIARQKPILKKILGKLVKLNPDIVYVQNIVNFTAKEYLESKGITIVCKVKSDVLDNIKKVAQIKKKIDKLWKVETYKAQQIVGTCQKLYFVKYQNNDIEKTLMYLQDPNSGVISIVIGHTDRHKLEVLKVIMEKLLTIARQLWLEKEIVQIEHQKVTRKNKQLEGGLISFLDEQYPSIEQLIATKSCRFSRVMYTPLKLSNLPDIQSLPMVDNYLKSLPYSFKHILTKHWEMCRKPMSLTKTFYSEQDVSLGSFFLLKMANMNMNCQYCQKHKHNHVSLFHLQSKYIKVWVQNPLPKPEHESQDLNKSKEGNIYISKEVLHVHLREKFKGQALTSKSKIVSFIECDDCKQVLTESFSLSKDYLQTSFQYFLLKLAMSPNLKYVSQKGDQNACKHPKLNRVIESDDGALKFQIGELQLYTLSNINLSSAESQKHLTMADLSHINSLVITQFTRLTEYVRSIRAQLEQFARSPENQSKRSLKYRQVQQKTIWLSQLLESHIDEKQAELSSNIQRLLADYTVATREIHIIILYLQFLYKIFGKIEQFHKKGRREDDEQDHLDDSLDASAVKLHNSGVETNANLQDIKDYLERHKKLEWANQSEAHLGFYAAVFKNDPVSMIACAINSKHYSKVKPDVEEIVVKIQLAERPQLGQISTLTGQIVEQLKLDSRYSKEESHQVRILFPNQFQEIRQSQQIDLSLYAKNLLDCVDWASSGGKSDARFKKSYSGLLVIKSIKDKEFIEFSKFFRLYHQHAKRKSYISKIFGMYEVDKEHYYIVMQNIQFNFDVKSITYDFKGADFKRLALYKDQKHFTGKDTNFKLDRNGEPLPLSRQSYNEFISTIEMDCDFLVERQVIDYSLLIIIDPVRRVIRVGIIDFMRPYKLTQLFQNLYKKLINGANPTVIQPNLYKERYFLSIEKYFLCVGEIQAPQD